jgi:prophage regulatory protein
MLKFLRLPEVEEVTGLSGTTIWRRERAGDFPSRRRLGPNAIGWLSYEIEEWIDSRPPADQAESVPGR